MNHTERDRLFRLLRAASRLETRLNQRTRRRQHGHLIRNYLWYFQVAPFSLAAAAAVLRKFFGAPEIIAGIGLSLLLLLYLATFLHPFLLAWLNRRFLVTAAKEPISLILNNANATTTVDSMVLPHLLRAPRDHLELLVLELKAEKEFFEKRLSLVVGAIEKVGLGPGLLAVGISLSNLKSDQSDWVWALAYATPVLYLFGVAAHFLLMRLDRYVKLVDLAIARTKSPTSPSS